MLDARTHKEQKNSTLVKGCAVFLSLSLKIYRNWSENLYPGYVICYSGKNTIKTYNGDLRNNRVYMNGDLRYTFDGKVECYMDKPVFKRKIYI